MTTESDMDEDETSIAPDTIITVEDAKRHLRVDDDEDYSLIASYIRAAESYISAFVDCSMTATQAPEPVKQAVRMLVASMYDQRESSIVGANLAVLAAPISVFDLISPYRRWCFG